MFLNFCYLANWFQPALKNKEINAPRQKLWKNELTCTMTEIVEMNSWPAAPTMNTSGPCTCFQCSRESGIIINTIKWNFGVLSLHFLGHFVDEDMIHPLQDKVRSIVGFPPPTSFRKLCEFLGLVNFYRRFIPGCVEATQPFTGLLQQQTKEEQQISSADAELAPFEKLKSFLSDVTMLVSSETRRSTLSAGRRIRFWSWMLCQSSSLTVYGNRCLSFPIG